MKVGWAARLPLARRRLCWAGAGWAAALWLSAWLLTRGIALPVWAALLCALLGGGLLVCKPLRSAALFLCLAWFGLGAAFFGLWRIQRVQPQLALVGRSGLLLCRATDYAQGQDGYGTLEAKALTLDGEKVRFSTVLFLEDASPHFEPGDLLAVSVRLDRAPLEPKRGYGQKEIFLLAKQIGPLERLPDRRPLSAWPAIAARQMAETFQRRLPGRKGALLTGIITGKKDSFTASQRRDLNLSGAAHLAAVSGLHISALLGAAVALLGRRWGGVLGLPLCLLMTLLAGGTPSALRALAMAVCSVGALWLRRDRDGPSALSAALVLILFFRPMSALDAGLQLSFSAAAGLAWLLPVMTESIRKALPGNGMGRRLLRSLLGALAASLAAQAFSMPISALVFQRVSLTALGTNLLLLPLLTPVLALGLLLAALDPVWPAAGREIAWLLRPLLGLMDWIQRKAASLPFASAAGGSIFLLLFAFGGAAAALFFVKKKRTGRSLAAVALCAVLCLSMAEIERAFTTRLTVVSSRGSSLILVSQGGRIAAFCSGRLRADRFYQTAQQALDRLGGDRIHQLWLTNPAGIGPIRSSESRWAQVDWLAGPEGLLPELALGQENWIYQSGGSFAFSGGRGVLLGQSGDFVLQLETPGCVVLAACGQKPVELLKVVQEQELTCDILVVDGDYAQDLPRLAAVCRRTEPDLLVCVQPVYEREEQTVGAAFSGPVVYLPDYSSLEIVCWAPPGKGGGLQ